MDFDDGRADVLVSTRMRVRTLASHVREAEARSDMIVGEKALPGRPGRFTRSTWCRGFGLSFGTLQGRDGC